VFGADTNFLFYLLIFQDKKIQALSNSLHELISPNSTGVALLAIITQGVLRYIMAQKYKKIQVFFTSKRNTT